MQPRFEIGTVYHYKLGAKIRRVYTVTDIYKTYNSAGELVKMRYVVQHDFCGQILTRYDVTETEIARALES